MFLLSMTKIIDECCKMKRSLMWPKCTKPLRAGGWGHMQASLYWLGIWRTIFQGNHKQLLSAF